MENKKGKAALNDELLEKVSGGEGDGICECGWMLAPAASV